MAVADFGDRWRVFFISTILSVWIFIIDGLNWSLNWYEDTESKIWAKFVVLVSGYLFCFPTLIGSFMLFVWVSPQNGALLIVFACFIAGTARLVATLLGFQDFWQESNLDSTTSGTTDVAIAGFQLYLLLDAFSLYRVAKKKIVFQEFQNDENEDTEHDALL
eukprot:455049_1